MAEKTVVPFFEQPFALFPSFSKFIQSNDLTQDSRGLTVYEDNKNNTLNVEAHLPGLDVKDIEIELAEGVLYIHGEKQEKQEDKEKKYFHRASSSYTYRLSLPSSIDGKEPKANYKDGVLKITFTKTSPQSKKIQIKSS